MALVSYSAFMNLSLRENKAYYTRIEFEHEKEPFPRSFANFFPWLPAVWVTAMAAVINCGILSRYTFSWIY